MSGDAHSRWRDAEPTLAPEQAVGRAIQDLAAARLGRGFVPLALLLLAALVELFLSGGVTRAALATAGGALATGGTMLAYAVRMVQRAFGREHRGWMTLAGLGSLIPPAFALYVLAWRGLRGLAMNQGWEAMAGAVFMTVVGGWFLQRWLKIVEIQRLADTMRGLTP